MKPPGLRHVPGKLRIIGGSLRGSKLTVLDAPGLRPTPDRVRETLFNWLMPVITGARCLDLFAGTGANGFEALSRGAAECVFVERDRAVAHLIADNLARLKATGGRIVHADALDFLRGTATPFDVVFVDPPFAAEVWDEAARRLEAGGWLVPGAWIHAEIPAAAEPAVPAPWRVHREGRAGAVRYTLYRRAGGDPLS